MPELLEFERYEILKRPGGSLVELGRGAMGITKAFGRNPQCNIALKVITASLLQSKIAAERFLRGARAAAQLRHRDAASVCHLDQHGNSVVYVREFIEGETVESLVRRGGPLDCRLTLVIVQQLAPALIAAEKQQLVHRGIRPSNLNERYRLVEDLNPDDPGRMFCAEEVVSKGRVSVQLIYGEPAVIAQAEEEANRVRAVSNPNFVRVHAVHRETRFSFVVCEWLDGFALTDVLRIRQALTVHETLLLLKQIAPAVDQGSAAKLRLDLNLKDIVLHFPAGPREPVTADVLMGCSLAEWPAFVVKLNALGEINALDPGATSRGERMASFSEKQPSVVSLGILTYAVLGGKAGGFVPLSGLTAAGNEVIRRCLTSAHRFATAQAFYEALSATDATADSQPYLSRPDPIRPRHPEPVAATSRAAAPGQPWPASVGKRGSAAKRSMPLILAALVCTGVLLLLGGAWLWRVASEPVTESAGMAPVTSLPKPVATAASPLPLQAGQPWVNSLEMRFVPLGNIHMAVWPTRVRDFQAFVQATGYDAMGGMSSVIVRDGFKLTTMGWKNPGFAQTAEHPVVGVSWEDANQFCIWLTQKERQAGLLGAVDRYRLPTDREWSAAVGLANEPGAVPEDRDGKVRGLYPWGRTFPPPPGAGNYAGAESSAGAPESWTVISGYHDPFPRTAPVSALAPNPRGLCGIGSNVWEWCLDKFNAALPWRTLRGASWATSRAEEMLSSSRRGYNPYFRSDDVGFRCVIAAGGGQP
ncbi:MAG: SUMF1/EgtB/PvdO family nonheme iron enzyme [Verrucomicrobia bacterium]|nr:SUMF1/EgtB/PvdO family nonheme iron enzyme [Verrucomicrobiota bacterium]